MPRQYDSTQWLGWLRTSVSVDEKEMLESCGLDNLMYYLYHKALLQFFGVFTLLCVIILIPVNATSGSNVTDGFTIISMANIPPHDTTRLTAHLIVAYIFFISAIIQMTRLYDKFMRLRQIHIKSMQTLYCNQHTNDTIDTVPLIDDTDELEIPPHQYSNMSLLIRDLPKQYQTPHTFQQYFTYLFGTDNVQSTYLPKDVQYLQHLNSERDKLENNLQHMTIQYQCACDAATQNHKATPSAPTKFLWSKLKSVDAFQWLHTEIERYNILIMKETRHIQSDETPYLNSGFVTLNKSVLHSLITYSTNITHNTLQCTISHSPEPDDVLYEQLNITHISRIVREYAVLGLTIALVLFWSIPITAISALTTLSNIGKSVPFVLNIVNVSPILSGFLSGFLPSLAFIIFQALLPRILLWFTKLEGKSSKSECDLGVYSKFYLFQFINFFIITVLAGAVLNEITSLINNPTSIVSLFGQSIPTVATQFLNYVIIQTFVSWPMSLLSGVRLIIGTLQYKLLSVTEYERDSAHSGITLSYGEQWPQDLLIYIIGVSYAIISPVILPFVFMYHVFGCICVKYQSLYMYDTPEFETGGMYWSLAFNRMCASLIIAQITLLGLFGLKQAPIQAGFCAVLIPATVLYAMQINQKWVPFTYSLSLHDAADVDTIRACSVRQHTDTSCYKQAELEVIHSSDSSGTRARQLFDLHNTMKFASKSVKKIGKHSKSVVTQLTKLTSPKRYNDNNKTSNNTVPFVRSNSEPVGETKSVDIVVDIRE